MSWAVLLQALIVAAVTAVVTAVVTGYVTGKVTQAHLGDLAERVVRIERYLNGLLEKHLKALR
jgi:hypothetical protein